MWPIAHLRGGATGGGSRRRVREGALVPGGLFVFQTDNPAFAAYARTYPMQDNYRAA